ncbi:MULTISPECIES: histidine kinase [unclassified Clostridium]|uniref:sensor histidine kinase n=1 Tax=unclassified Clostridium TaxID=2614128 RepID=UPI000297D552|nr:MULTISPECIES: histidine kinase [unclassified Clostridium]EKQ57551.1 MAG: putative regulator of cell autolysis [Clostridium sp. Maddingley MBC34-26]
MIIVYKIRALNNFIKKYLSNFQNRIIVCFILCTIIPLLAIGLISYHTSVKIAQDKIINSNLLLNNQLKVNVNNRVIQIEHVADSIQFYLYSLNTTPTFPLSNYLTVFNNTSNNIDILKNNFNIFYINAFVDPNLIISKRKINFNSIKDIESYGIHENELLNLGISPQWVFKPKQNFPYMISNSNDGVDAIFCYRSVKNNNSDSLLYAYFISIKSDEFSEILKNSSIDTSITNYIVDENGVIIAHSDKSKVGNSLDNEKLALIKQNVLTGGLSPYKDSKILSSKSINGWYIVTDIPQKYILDNTFPLIKLIIFSIFLLTPVFIFIAISLGKELTKRLNKLSIIIKSAEFNNSNLIKIDNMNELVDSKDLYYDDIDYIALTFQEMINTINNNFNTILDLSVKKEKLNYDLLQAQINPHFLYNILDSIHICNSLGKFDIANQIIRDLSKFYRYVLRTSDNLITIQEELEIAKLYLSMENICKNGNITWNLYLDESIENFLIPKLILQPLIENCIKHGIGQGGNKIHIDISITYSENYILIKIKDNGVGIESNRLIDIQCVLKTNNVSNKYLGLSNVNARLYSSKISNEYIKIASNLNNGTKIEILINQII